MRRARPRPTSGDAVAPRPRRPRRSSSPAAHAASPGGSARDRGGRRRRATETNVSTSCTVPVPAKMKRWSRSPSQRKKPDSTNSSAKATVRRALIFWPALNRPCGAGRPRSQRRSSRSIVSISRQSAARRLRLPATTITTIATEPGDGDPDVDVLDEVAAADPDREARDVEDQPGREQGEERRGVHPVERPLGAREPQQSPRARPAQSPFERPTQASTS